MPAGQKIRVLFLCVGNSCRSQMAQGWAKHIKGNVIEAYSAGVSPGSLNPKAIEVMKEAGVDISGHRSKHVDELSGIDFDYVVTLCDKARGQCPVFGPAAKVIHRSFEDPSLVTGTAEEVTAAYRNVRDEIRSLVETMPESLPAIWSQQHLK